MIQLKHLTKLYKNKRGIRNISLEIPDGEILGLLGPNGSGKTTIMKALLSLIPADSGEIIINGSPLHKDFENIMSRTGALIESPAIYKNMTAYQNMKLMARSREDLADIDRMLDIVHLREYKNDKAGRFSLGMKQRLGLAAALIGKPETVILDEPVNGLDIEGVVEIREYIKEMNRALGTTFIVSSHIASEIERLCTSVAVICDGEIISLDSTEHIKGTHPSMEDYFLEKIRERRGGI